MDRHIAKVWELEFPSPTHKFITLCIARLSVRSGLCYAKQKTIAADTGFHFKTVQKTLAELEEMGWIVRRGFLKDDGSRGADRIWLTLPEVVLQADTPVDDDPLSDGRAFEKASGERKDKGSRGLHQGSGTRPPSPSVDPTLPAEDSSKSQGDSRESKGEDARDAHEPAEQSIEGVDLDSAMQVIWAGVGDLGRKRSAKAKVTKALSAALARRPRGVSAEDHLKRIMGGVRAYLQHPDTRKEGGRFEHGAHRTLENDVWESYLDDAPARAASGDHSTPDPDMGSVEEPGPKLMRYWMDTHRQGLPWHAERGPRPGMPGCRVSPALQVEFGIEPWFAPGTPEHTAQQQQAAARRDYLAYEPRSAILAAMTPPAPADDDASAFL